MTGTREAQEISERAFVKDMPDGLARALMPAPWAPDEHEEIYPAALPDRVLAPSERARVLLDAAWLNLSRALSREVGRGIFFLLFPVMMGVGAVVYFTLSFEPDWVPLLSTLTTVFILRFCAQTLLAIAIADARRGSAARHDSGEI